MSLKNVVVLGATGFIGRQCLEITKQLEGFSAIGLAARSDWEGLLDAVTAHRPGFVAMSDVRAARELEEALRSRGIRDIRVFRGLDGVCELATLREADVVVHAIPGFEGLYPLLAALEAGKTVALAGKEALVSAGDLVAKTAERHGGRVIPVDSEHNAIFQLLAGEDRSDVVKVVLTASGGPFWHLGRDEMARVTPAEALRHPTWQMGPKITVDSSTLFNKALEVIEAHHLFGLDYGQISVLVHRESIVHSLVVLRDGSVKALLANPDMKMPIAYALRYPCRGPSCTTPLDLGGKTLSFEEPDLDRFPCLGLGFRAGRMGGTTPCFVSAADEVVVEMFLAGTVPYLAIYPILSLALDGYEPVDASDLSVLEEEARRGKLVVGEIVSAGRWLR